MGAGTVTTPLRTHVERLALAELKPQEINARFLPHEQHVALVTNLRRDGVLTSAPLVRVDGDGHRILSGHHRVKAAIEAGIDDADCIVIDDQLTRQQEVAIVLSHNSIAGEDDPATLKRLYDELEDVDWRSYSGLDDQTLELLDTVSAESLSVAAMDFTTVTLLFLPHEKAAAEEAFADAMDLIKTDETWLAREGQYDGVLDALATAHAGASVGNVATALSVILEVFEQRIGDVRAWWLEGEGEPKTKSRVPIESMFGTRTMPAEAGAVVARAVDRIAGREDLAEHERWRALEFLAASYLAEG
jgi:hypothetical protein